MRIYTICICICIYIYVCVCVCLYIYILYVFTRLFLLNVATDIFKTESQYDFVSNIQICITNIYIYIYT